MVRFIRVFRNDIRCGWNWERNTYLAIVLLALFSCVECKLKVIHSYLYSVRENAGLTPDKYLFHLYGGNLPYDRMDADKFEFPVLWFLLHLLMLYGAINYPYRSMEQAGTQKLLRSIKRSHYWLAKVLWQIWHVMLCFLLIHVVVILFSVLFADAWQMNWDEGLFSMIFQIEEERFAINPELYLFTMLTFFVTDITICILEMMLGLIMKPLFGFLCMTVLLLASSYLQHPLLLGNYCMTLRSRFAIPTGYRWETGGMVSLCFLLVSIVGGMLYFNKCDILGQEK